MAELYQANNVVITDETVSINGNSTPLSEFLRAEEYQVQDIARNALLLLIGCLMPILSMIFFVQAGLIAELRLWFGPTILVVGVGFGLIAVAIGHFWQRPWAVVVERDGIGFDPLFRCANQEEAAKAASAINKAIGA